VIGIDNHIFIEKLMTFGLSRQEATIYMSLLMKSELTGYEAAKSTGISRSNVYSALAGLTEKGAAYVMEGTATKYIPVVVEEFCKNKIKIMMEEQQFLVENVPVPEEQMEGYITIEGDRNIVNKMRNMMTLAEQRIYLSMSYQNLLSFEKEIKECVSRNIKVVVITDQETVYQGVTLFIAENKGNQVRLIADSSKVLTGDYGKGKFDTCLYSGQKDFVNLLKDALRNEIKLIEILKGKEL
jgi:sugar-specific transcriptional regulator TrmB